MPRFLSTATIENLTLPTVVAIENGPQPTAFLIAILDGSDQFDREHGPTRAATKEATHRRLCRQGLLVAGGELSEPFDLVFRDAVFAEFFGNDGLHRAIAAAARINRQLNQWNAEHQLSWIDQVHSRLSVSADSYATAFTLLPQAVRGGVVVAPDAWNRLTVSAALLAELGMEMHSAAMPEVWDEVICELDSGVELPPADSDLAKAVRKYLLQSQELSLASAQHARAGSI